MPTEDGSPASLLDLARSKRRLRGSRCTIAKLIAAHPDKAPQIEELIANSGDGHGEAITYAVSAEIISEATGSKVDGQTISRHNRGRCACS